MCGDLILLSISHPYELLPVGVEIEHGIKLTNDFLVPIVLESHHLCQLKSVTSLFYVIEVLVPSS
jgi:hypothetical protein